MKVPESRLGAGGGPFPLAPRQHEQPALVPLVDGIAGDLLWREGVIICRGVREVGHPFSSTLRAPHPQKRDA